MRIFLEHFFREHQWAAASESENLKPTPKAIAPQVFIVTLSDDHNRAFKRCYKILLQPILIKKYDGFLRHSYYNGWYL